MYGIKCPVKFFVFVVVVVNRIETMELIWNSHDSSKNPNLIGALQQEVNIVLILISTFTECLLCTWHCINDFDVI